MNYSGECARTQKSKILLSEVDHLATRSHFELLRRVHRALPEKQKASSNRGFSLKAGKARSGLCPASRTGNSAAVGRLEDRVLLSDTVALRDEGLRGIRCVELEHVVVTGHCPA